jgi:hypothetical protein
MRYVYDGEVRGMDVIGANDVNSLWHRAHRLQDSQRARSRLCKCFGGDANERTDTFGTMAEFSMHVLTIDGAYRRASHLCT